MQNFVYDTIIIGGGPAGLAAGIYTSRARLKTLLLETFDPSGQAVITDRIENYPGFPNGISGFELIDKFKKQAEEFGLKTLTVKVIKIKKREEDWEIIAEGRQYRALSVIVASGASPKNLGVPGEKEFLGKGISYCATCDGPLFRDKDITVIGGGDTAVEEALFLTKFAKSITLIHRRDRLRAAKIIQERILENKKVNIQWNSVVSAIEGKNNVEGVRIKNVKTQEETVVSCKGVFVFIGLIPNTNFLEGVVKLNEKGYIITNPNMGTSEKGIFACGDCTEKLLRQVVTAAGNGATAAFSAQQYVDEIKGTVYK